MAIQKTEKQFDKKVKIENFEVPIKFVKKINMQIESEETPIFQLLLEIPFSRDFLKDFIIFE
jgi:hypothetical protein